MEPVAVLRLLLTASGVKETQLELARLQAEAKRTAASTGQLERQVGGLDSSMGSLGRETKRTAGATGGMQRQMGLFARETKRTADSTSTAQRQMNLFGKEIASAATEAGGQMSIFSKEVGKAEVETNRAADSAGELDRRYGHLGGVLGRLGGILGRFGVDSNRTATATEKIEGRFSRLDNTVGDFNRVMMGARNVLMILKWPAVIAGAGMAAQAVGALGAATVGLVGALGPATGAIAGYAGLWSAVAQGTMVARLGLANVSEALKGSKKAMDALTPAQRTFVNQLKGMKGELQGLRNTAAQGMFPGFAQALRIARPLIDQLRPVIGATARVLGDLAVQAAHAARAMGPELQRIGTTNVGVLRNLGSAAISLGRGLLEVLDAARPLTMWFSDLARRGAQWVDVQARAANESGKLSNFFASTQVVLGQLGRLLVNFGVGLFSIFKAAAPLGQNLLRQFVDLSQRFRDWTESARGQNAIAQYFRDVRGPVREVFGLIGDVTRVLANLFRPTRDTAGMVGNLRELVKVLGSMFQTTTRTLGPALMETLTNLARILASLAGTSGPLNTLFRALAGLTGVIADLVKNNSALATMVSFTVGLGSAGKLLGFLLKPLSGVVGLFGGLSRTMGVLIRGGGFIGALTAGFPKLGKMAGGLSKVGGALKGVSAAMAAFDIASMLNPVGAVIASVALLGTALALLITHFKEVTGFLRGPWGTAISIALAVMMPFIGIPLLIMAHWRSIANFFVGLWNGIKHVFSAGVNAVVGFFSKLPGRVLGILKGVGGALVSVGRTIVHGLVTGVTTAASAIWHFFSALPARVLGILRGVGGTLLGVGRTIIQGLVRGIAAAAGAIWNWFRALPARILGLIKGVGQTLFNVGKTIVGGLAKGISAATGVLKGAFEGIKTIISDVVSGIKTAFRAVLGVISGILGTAGDVFSVLSHVPGLGFLSGVADGAHKAAAGIDRLRNSLKETPPQAKRVGGALQGMGQKTEAVIGNSSGLTRAWTGGMRQIWGSTNTNMPKTARSVTDNTGKANTVGSRNMKNFHGSTKFHMDNAASNVNVDTQHMLTNTVTRTTQMALKGAKQMGDFHGHVKTNMDNSAGTTNTNTGRMLTLIGQRTVASATTAAKNMGPGGFFGTIRGNMQSAYNAVRDGGNQMLGAVKKMMSGFGGGTIKIASIVSHNVLGAIGAGARGGMVDKPTFLVGEEAPTHPEYVISTNPRDRSRMVPLVQQAARHIGAMPRVPGYAVGGIVTASQYDGTGSASGRDAHTTVGYAELSNPPSSLNFSALGHLPMGYRLRIGYGGRSIVAPKIDVGAGGPGLHGHIRAIDLTMPASRLLNFSGLADVNVASAGGAPLSIGGGPGGAALFQQITAPRVQGGGTMGRVAQAALNKIADAANAYASAHMPVAGGGGGMMPMFPVPSGPLPLRVRTAIGAANSIVGKPYIYGGGHGSWISPGYCCSGAVSYVLHAAGLLNSPMAGGGFWPGGAAGYVSGPGKYFTVGTRGSATGPGGHVMMEIAGRGFESGGSGGGPHWTSGWDGAFDHYTHPPGWARGGVIPPGHFGEQRKAVGQLYNIMARQGAQPPFRRTDGPKQAERALNAHAKAHLRPARPLLSGRRTDAVPHIPRPGFAHGGMLPPYAGSFAVGGRVPGPAGAARTAIVHGGETISHADSEVFSLRRPLLEIHEELRRIYRRFHPLLERILRKITEGARPARDTASAVARLAAPRARREPTVRTAAAHARDRAQARPTARRPAHPVAPGHDIPRRLYQPRQVREALQRMHQAGRAQRRIDQTRQRDTAGAQLGGFTRRLRAGHLTGGRGRRGPRHLWQLAGFTQQLQRAIERGGGDATLADLRDRLRTIASLQVQDPASIAQLLRDTLPLSEAQPTAADIQALLRPALQRNYGAPRAPISALRGARNPALLARHHAARRRQVHHHLARHRQAQRRGDHHRPRLHHPHHARRQHRPHQLWQLSNFISAVRQQVGRFGGTTTYTQLHDALRAISYMQLTDPQDIAQLLYDSLPLGTVQPTPAQIQRLLRPALVKNYGAPRAILPPPVKAPYAGTFATGGTVPGPSGMPLLATVHGGETITPRQRAAPTVHINNMIVQDDFDEQVLAYKLAWLIDA